MAKWGKYLEEFLAKKSAESRVESPPPKPTAQETWDALTPIIPTLLKAGSDDDFLTSLAQATLSHPTAEQAAAEAERLRNSSDSFVSSSRNPIVDDQTRVARQREEVARQRTELAEFRHEQERRLVPQAPPMTAAQVEAMQSAQERIMNQYRTISTVSSPNGAMGYFYPTPTTEPKKPVEIPILTFGKRRINLKDVA